MTRTLTHVETAHSYVFGPGDDPEAVPYAVEQLHRDLHARGDRHRCGQRQALGIDPGPGAPIVVCGLRPGHDGAHDAPIPGGGRLTWRSDVERRPIAAETNRPIYPAAGPGPADSDPGYRAAMRDAGRGHLVR